MERWSINLKGTTLEVQYEKDVRYSKSYTRCFVFLRALEIHFKDEGMTLTREQQTKHVEASTQLSETEVSVKECEDHEHQTLFNYYLCARRETML
jgi:hypothetical protein